MQNTKGGLRFAIADYAPGLESFPGRSKQCAIVYIGIADLNSTNKSLLSVICTIFSGAVGALGGNRRDHGCLSYEQGYSGHRARPPEGFAFGARRHLTGDLAGARGSPVAQNVA